MTSNKVERITMPEEWGRMYKEKYNAYQDYAKRLEYLICELLQKFDIKFAEIESRAKEIDTFVEKIQREGKNYENPLKEVTDLAGVRIIAYYKDDVDKICEIIEKEFDIDWENSINRAQVLDPNEFGYLSIHYVISLSHSRKELTEWKTFADMKAEIQVRTALQHAWASIDHELRYKQEIEIPKDLRRRLHSLSALLELADGEFSNLRKLIEEIKEQYSQEVERRELEIELNLSSLEIYLDSTKSDIEWMRMAENVGYKPIPFPDEEVVLSKVFSRTLGTLLGILHSTGITTMARLDAILEDASKWGMDILTRFLEISSQEGYSPYANPYLVLIVLVLYARKEYVDHNIVEQTEFQGEIRNAIKKFINTMH